jgi:hypothetical protein
VDREGRQHFQDQQKIGNIRKLIKKREGGKLISVTTKVLYGNAEEVKNKLGCHTAYVERTSLLITNDEWATRPQDAFVLKRASFSSSR